MSDVQCKDAHTLYFESSVSELSVCVANKGCLMPPWLSEYCLLTHCWLPQMYYFPVCSLHEVSSVLSEVFVTTGAQVMEFSSPVLQLFLLFIFKDDTSSVIELSLSCYSSLLEGTLEFYHLLAPHSSLPDFLLYLPPKEGAVTEVAWGHSLLKEVTAVLRTVMFDSGNTWCSCTQ